MRRLTIWLAVAVGLLVLLAVIGIPLPLGPFTSRIESSASDALKRRIRIGSLGLVIGIHPRLVVEDLHLAHGLPDRPALLHAERAELELSLLSLIRKRLHVVRAAVEGVSARIDPEAFPESATEAAAPDDSESGLMRAAQWSLDVDELALANFDLELHRPDSELVEATLERLDATLSWDESLELALSGQFRGYPISARIEGASMAELIAGAEAWPLRLAMELAGSPIEFAAELTTGEDLYRIERMQGRAGETSLAGWLALENFTTKPRARGRIEIGAVELALPEHTKTSPPTDEARAEPGADRPADAPGLFATGSAPDSESEDGPGPLNLFMEMLSDYESDLELEIARIAGVGPTVEDLAVALRVSDGELLFPVSLTADGIPMSGTLRVDRVEDLPHLFFQLTAEHFRVDEIAARILPNAEIMGPFEALRLEFEGRGNSLVGFLETLRIDLVMKDAALTYGVERPVPFGVETFQLALAEFGPIKLEVQGSLLGEAIALDLSGGTMATFLSVAPWDLQLAVRGAGATIELSGEALGLLPELDLLGNLSIHGEKLSSLEPWIGVVPVPDAPYSIRAQIDDRPDSSHIVLEDVRLGETHLAGELGQLGRKDEPLLRAKLRIEHLDVSPYLEAAGRKRAGADDELEASEGGAAFETPILPGGIAIDDADFDFRVGRLVAGDLELGDLIFAGAFREGFLPESNFGFRLGGASFEGGTTIDLREPPHSATFTFGTHDVDVGRLLAQLGLAEGIESRAGALRIDVSGEGATLADVLQRSEVLARLDDLHWTLRDPNSDADIQMILDRGELTSPRGDEPIRLVAEGSLRGVPVLLSMQTRQLSFFERPEERVPLDVRLEMAGATLEISSAVLLPIERSELELSLKLEGRSLENASPLVAYELPAIGPYRLASRMRLTRDDYRLADFDLRVGASRLRGNGRLDLRGARPRIELELESELVQIDDFAAAFETTDEVETEPSEPTPPPADAPPSAGLERAREFWSPEGLLGFDARLDVRVDRVLSGKDELGSGELAVRLEDGKLAVDPLSLELPGGPFEMRTEYAYVARETGYDVEARVRANTERFDYGPLARRVDPETDMGGWISLDIDIAGGAPEARTLLAHADGRFDFMTAPENIVTDVFDLWAVSLLRFMLPHLDPGPRSTLNCVVARFDLKDGILKERALFLDTTGMIVKGDAEVDFRKERFSAVMTPSPKQAEPLSLQTPVAIEGGFDEFRVGVPPAEVLMTVLRFASSIVVAPIQRLFGKPLPEDGEPTCIAAWREGKE